MKKGTVVLLVVLVAVVASVIGYGFGTRAVITAPKWVEEADGLYLIVTDFGGNEYIDIAEKAAHEYESFAFAMGRTR